jgi:hypothetical protein
MTPPLVNSRPGKPALPPFPSRDIALVFGGIRTGAIMDTLDEYSFASGLRRVTAGPHLMRTAREYCSSASSRTRAMVFGGDVTNTSAFTGLVDYYDFATLSSVAGAAALETDSGYMAAAGDNSTMALVFGGYGPDILSRVEQYFFASPGTKGTVPATPGPAYPHETSVGRQGPCAASNSSAAFVFGGYHAFSYKNGDRYNFSSLGSLGAAPAALSTGRFDSGACGNATIAIIFGGYWSTQADPPEVYSFSTGLQVAGPAALLTSRRTGNSSAGNSTNAFVFGGSDESAVLLDTCENYVFATNGTTKGASPATLDYPKMRTAACSDHQ